MDTILEMYYKFREDFPELTEKTDREHTRLWGEVDPEFCYSWFGSLANTLNHEMSKEVEAIKYKNVFEFIRHEFHSGSDEIKNCIDVSFTENLFWQIKPEHALSYWQIFPEVLKELYVNFHGHSPV